MCRRDVPVPVAATGCSYSSVALEIKPKQVVRSGKRKHGPGWLEHGTRNTKAGNRNPNGPRGDGQDNGRNTANRIGKRERGIVEKGLRNFLEGALAETAVKCDIIASL